jgi:hypothetical protein
MVADPAAAPVARPVLETVAVDAGEAVHVTWEVKSCVWVCCPTRIAVAWNCCVVPLRMPGFAGVTASNWTPATVKTVDPEMPLEVAAIVVVPSLCPVATPAAVILATVDADELHVNWVRTFWLPSL